MWPIVPTNNEPKDTKGQSKFPPSYVVLTCSHYLVDDSASHFACSLLLFCHNNLHVTVHCEKAPFNTMMRTVWRTVQSTQFLCSSCG